MLVYNTETDRVEYLVELDNNGQPIIVNLDYIQNTTPSNPQEKQVWFNTSNNKIYTYKNGQWVETGEPSVGVWYYDETNDQYYLWDGNSLDQIELSIYEKVENKSNNYNDTSKVHYASSFALSQGLSTVKPIRITDSGSTLPAASGYQLNDTFLNTTNNKLYTIISNAYQLNTNVQAGNKLTINYQTCEVSGFQGGSQYGDGYFIRTFNTCQWNGNHNYKVRFKLTQYKDNDVQGSVIGFSRNNGSATTDYMIFGIDSDKKVYYYKSEQSYGNFYNYIKTLLFDYEIKLNRNYDLLVTKTGIICNATLLENDVEVATNTIEVEEFVNNWYKYGISLGYGILENSSGVAHGYLTYGVINADPIYTTGDFFVSDGVYVWNSGEALTDLSQYADMTNGILYFYCDNTLFSNVPAFARITGQPTDNVNLAAALDAKQDVSNITDDYTETSSVKYPSSKALSDVNKSAVKSVNDQLPDTNGNVVISNVASADQLNSPDSINDYGEFVFRTSAGTKSISSDSNTYLSQATLLSLQGNIENPRRSLNNIDTEQSEAQRVYVSIDTVTFGISVNHVSGDYTFNFDGNDWTLQGDTPIVVNIEYYGITLSSTALNGDSFTVTYFYDDSGEEPIEYATATYAAINRLTIAVDESTFDTKINNVIGSYNFLFNGSVWMINKNIANLSEYGITITGTPINDDSITITYNGDMKVATPTSFVTSSFNAFNPANILTDCTINENGEIVASAGSYVAYIHGVGGLDNINSGGSRHGDYTIFDDNETLVRIGYSATIPTTTSTVILNSADVSVNTNSGSTSKQWITFKQDGYICVALTDITKLCVHPEWSGYMDDIYQDYIAPVTWANNTPVDGKRTKPSIINIPTTGYLEDDETHEQKNLPCANYLGKVGLIYDEILFREHKYINRIGYKTYSTANLEEVEQMGTDYVYDSNGIYYVLPNAQTYIINYNIVDNEVVLDTNEEGEYMVCDFGTEEFMNTEVGLIGNFLYGNNLVDKLRTDVLTKSPQTLSPEQQRQIWKNLGTLPLYNYSKTIQSNALLVIVLEEVYTFYDLTPETNITSITIDDSQLLEKENAWYTFYLHVNMDNPTTTVYDIDWNSNPNITWGNTSPTMTAGCHYLFSFTKPKGSSVWVGNQCYTWME